MLKVFLALFLVDFAFGATSETLKVQLNHGGVLVGRHLETVKGRHIRSFLGIPYAKPPVDDLRFKSPVPISSWEGTKLAIKEGSICTQIDYMMGGGAPVGTEDCLYLNVYTPPLDVIKSKGDLPVMVYFHGGGFSMGSGNRELYGPDYFLEEDIILVTGNYRLGSLGFLSTETLDSPGNFGLKDQLEILKWVKSHIKSFGGNPDSLTIFGESAGAGSVAHHLQSPKSKGLFHSAILQSGTIFNPWAYPPRKGFASNYALRLAKLFDCDVEGKNWSKIIECLRKVDPVEMIKKETEFAEFANYPACIFRPVVEPKHSEAFVEDLPRVSGLNSNDIPVIVGIVADEGLLLDAPLLANPEVFPTFKEKARDLFPLMMYFDHFDKNQQKKIVDEIDKFYFKNGYDFDLKNHRNLTDLLSDSFFAAGFDEYLEKRLSDKSASTYVYIFDHRPAGSLTNIMGGGEESLGVCHADELAILFPLGNLLYPTGVYTDKDIKMREAMVGMWANFATHGNPTPSGSDFKWEPSKSYPYNYARLGSQDLSDWYVLRNENNYARDRFDFWKKLNFIFDENKVVRDEL